MPTVVSPWTDRRKPSIGNLIHREDGRICRVKKYLTVPIRRANAQDKLRLMGQPLGSSELPSTAVGMLYDLPTVETCCGQKIPPKIISMLVFWPAVATEASLPTCPVCK